MGEARVHVVDGSGGAVGIHGGIARERGPPACDLLDRVADRRDIGAAGNLRKRCTGGGVEIAGTGAAGERAIERVPDRLALRVISEPDAEGARPLLLDGQSPAGFGRFPPEANQTGGRLRVSGDARQPNEQQCRNARQPYPIDCVRVFVASKNVLFSLVHFASLQE